MATDVVRANKLLAHWYMRVGQGAKAGKLCARQGFDQQEIRDMKLGSQGGEDAGKRSGEAAASA